MVEFQKFTKEDCGKPMTQEESRKVQVDMLDALASFCDNHGLRYYLSGGTLLGAIRHKGFIPWDDDIDVNMPRPDVEKLYDLTNGILDKYILAKPDYTGFSKSCGFFRLYNFNTVIENFAGGADKKHPSYHPIFIDIFPIEGLPSGKVQTKLHYLKIDALRRMQRTASLDHMSAKSLGAHIFHIISFIPAKLVGYKKWSKLIQKTAKKYDFNEQEYVGVMTAPVHTTNEKVKKDDYIKPVEVLFENNYYHAPANYDVYLSQLYGDYMKMPPKDKQKSHHAFNMYWKNKI